MNLHPSVNLSPCASILGSLLMRRNWDGFVWFFFPLFWVQNNCVGTETENFTGTFNATIHIVSGNGGRGLDTPGLLNTTWSLVRDYAHYGFMKLTASDHQNLLVEYKLSKDGSVFDSFTISREYTDVLGCDNTNTRNCPESTDADL